MGMGQARVFTPQRFSAQYSKEREEWPAARIALSLHLRGGLVHWCRSSAISGVPLEKYTAEDPAANIQRKALRATLHRLLRAANRGGG